MYKKAEIPKKFANIMQKLKLIKANTTLFIAI